VVDAERDPFEAKSGPELVFGLVGPLGASLSSLCDILVRELKAVGYDSHVIRLSDFLTEIKGLETELSDTNEAKRIESRMNAGTELRQKTRRGDLLALMGIAEIRTIREEITGDNNKPAEKRAYIFRSLKHKKEIELLRDIYGEGFITISAYCPKENRKRSLVKAIADSMNTTNTSKHLPEAVRLIEKDLSEEGTELGQDVSGAFPLADVFFDTTNRASLEVRLECFIQILFGHQFHTPSKDEFGMFQAQAASMRSADLSRQVGAAITTQNGDLVALGCNEVPKAGGGMYWADDDGHDGRDFQLGYDPAARAKDKMLSELIARLNDAGLLKKKHTKNGLTNLVDSLLLGEDASVLEDAQIKDILEFGRIVHAEMAAITDASRRGIPLQDTTLYCTTFPCHLCARLIIASGIKRVVYIEPYPKSKTEELYEDSVVVDRPDGCSSKVKFESFMGIAPRRYMDFFRKHTRKDKYGNTVTWNKEDSRPRMRRFRAEYIVAERIAVEFLISKINENNLQIT